MSLKLRLATDWMILNQILGLIYPPKDHKGSWPDPQLVATKSQIVSVKHDLSDSRLGSFRLILHQRQ